MRTLIDCDATFEALTRGPFPGGDDFDEAVEAHLASCHDCRALAEALRPAVDLFHECLEDDERTCLPRYTASTNDAESLEQRILTVVASESAKMSPQDSRFNSQRTAHYVLVPFILLVLTALVFRGLSGLSDSPAAVASAANSVDGMTLLAALSIPASCVAEGQGDAVIAVEDRIACCTNCHALANPNRPVVPCVAQLTIACSACHMATTAATGCCDDCHDVDRRAIVHHLAHAVGSENQVEQRLITACDACHDKARSS